MSLKVPQISNSGISPLYTLGLGISFSMSNTPRSKQCFGKIGDFFARFGICCRAYAASGYPKFSLSAFQTYFQKYDLWNVFFCKNKCSFGRKYISIYIFSISIYEPKIYSYITDNEAITLARDVYACARHMIIWLFDYLSHWQLHRKNGSWFLRPETTHERGAA